MIALPDCRARSLSQAEAAAIQAQADELAGKLITAIRVRTAQMEAESDGTEMSSVEGISLLCQSEAISEAYSALQGEYEAIKDVLSAAEKDIFKGKLAELKKTAEEAESAAIQAQADELTAMLHENIAVESDVSRREIIIDTVVRRAHTAMHAEYGAIEGVLSDAERAIFQAELADLKKTADEAEAAAIQAQADELTAFIGARIESEGDVGGMGRESVIDSAARAAYTAMQAEYDEIKDTISEAEQASFEAELAELQRTADGAESAAIQVHADKLTAVLNAKIEAESEGMEREEVIESAISEAYVAMQSEYVEIADVLSEAEREVFEAELAMLEEQFTKKRDSTDDSVGDDAGSGLADDAEATEDVMQRCAVMIQTAVRRKLAMAALSLFRDAARMIQTAFHAERQNANVAVREPLLLALNAHPDTQR
jgi:hypothetical protein